MKQIQFASFGKPSQVARCVDVADVGAPAAWEVVVDVEAFPINPADLAMLSGRYGKLPKLPSTIGMEAVGRVSQHGAAVKDISIGDRVVILANDNWAERRKVPAAAVHKVPEQGDAAQYSMMKVNPATAWIMLTEYVKLAAGEAIIQTAPLSSVGRCIIQLAKAKGIRTINVVRRADARPLVSALGGDIVLEDGPDLAERVRAANTNRPIRLAMDAVAGPGVQRLAECLSEGGQILNYGILSGESCQLSAEQAIFRGITLTGFWLSKILNRLTVPARATLFDSLSAMIARGTIQMEVDTRFPISQIDEALSRAERGGRNGKILVSPTS